MGAKFTYRLELYLVKCFRALWNGNITNMCIINDSISTL